jgi:FlaA1/EpsC-like NDP-sugar epimerase
VAHRLAAASPRPVQVVFTGLRPGEKLHEDLWAGGEVDERPVHPLISHVTVPPLTPLAARGINPWASSEKVVEQLAALCGVRASGHGAASSPRDAETLEAGAFPAGALLRRGTA